MKKIIKENKFFIISVLIIIILFYIKLPYYVNAPGGTININNRIEYKGKKNYKGSLNMLYVTEYVATIPTYLITYINKDWDLESINESRISNETVEEIEYRNKILLDNSINNAEYIAYKEAGKEIKIISKKSVIIGTTLENGLKIGDEILEVDNIPVDTIETIKKEIIKKEIGDTLNLKINRNNTEKNIEVEIKETGNAKAIGAMMVTNYQYKLSPKIKLKFKRSESGSSGGLMMALTIYNAISGEDLLKGRNIAGTGTIDEEGNIGEIAGIKYKIIGAHRNKMDIVLVPSGNYKEAVKIAKEKKYKMKIVEIKTFKDAINYLKEN